MKTYVWTRNIYKHATSINIAHVSHLIPTETNKYIFTEITLSGTLGSL